MYKIKILLLFVILTFGHVLSAQNVIHPKIAGPAGTYVNSYNGVLFFGRTDLETRNSQMPMQLRFYYNSSYNHRNCGFGNGFTLGLAMTYEIDEVGGVTIESGDGRQDHYARYGNEYEAPAGVFSTLTQPKQGQYLLTEKTGDKYEFFDEENGHLTAYEDRFGNRTEYTWQDTLLTGIRDAAGHTITLTYTNGLLTSAKASFLNGTVTYTYDEQRRLRNVTDPENGVIVYGYDAKDHICRITDQVGNITTIVYNNSNMVSRLKTAVSDKSIRYEKNKTVFIDYTQPKNQYSYYLWDEKGRVIEKKGLCCGIQSRLQYDEDDNVIARTDANGNTTRYTYDGNGNMLSITDPLGHTEQYIYTADFNQVASYTDKNGNRYTFTYDNKGCLTTIAGPLGFTNKFTYDSHGWQTTATDANGNTTTTAYNNDGTIASITTATGGVSRYEYDSYENLVSFTDALDNKTTYAYDKVGRLTQQKNALGGTAAISYDNAGQIVRVRDAANHITAFTYNAAGDILTQTDALGGVTTYTYDGKGNILTAKDAIGRVYTYSWDERNRLLSATNPAGETTTYDYDGAGNLLAVIQPNGNTVTYEYDNANRVISVSDKMGVIAQYTYDGNGNRLTLTDGENRTMRYEYDALNRLLSQTNPSGSATKYTYDNNSNLTAVEDALHNMTKYTWSPLNQMLTSTDALNAITRYEYDATGNLVRQTDARGNATQYTYDALNRNTVITFANATSLQYTYDATGNIITLKDRAGNSITIGYDALGRLTSRRYADNTTDTYTYDAVGQMLSAVNKAANVQFTYDAAGRLLSEKLNGKTTAFGYDVANGIRTMTYASGTMVTERLNARNLISSILKDGNEAETRIYNSASQLTQKVYANGITTDYTYNANGWIENITADKSVLSLKMTYDAVGNITKRAYLLDDSRTENYTYDAIGQILSQTRGSSKTEWQYDLLGNRVKELKNGVATNYTANNINAYTAVSGAINVTPTYDGNGNLLTDGSHTYQYDLSNRLSSADNKAATYAYDALGRRISKATADGTLTYCYVGNQMVEEYKDGTLSRQWLYGDDIDDAVMMQVGNDSYWYHTNHLGSPMCLTDSKGNIVERYEYDAFGAPSFFDAQGNTLSQSKVGNTILFTGREYDYETGTYYFRARQQHPLFGRFMQHDPLMYIDGMNDYAYVGNMSTVYVDIFGTKRNPVLDFLIGGCLDLPKNWKCADNAWQKAVAIALCGLDIAGFIPALAPEAKGAKGLVKGAQFAGKNLADEAAKKAFHEAAEKVSKEAIEKAAKEKAAKESPQKLLDITSKGKTSPSYKGNKMDAGSMPEYKPTEGNPFYQPEKPSVKPDNSNKINVDENKVREQFNNIVPKENHKIDFNA